MQDIYTPKQVRHEQARKKRGMKVFTQVLIPPCEDLFASLFGFLSLFGHQLQFIPNTVMCIIRKY